MTTQNKSALIERALLNLEEVGAGDQASAEDQATIDSSLGPVIALLAAKEVYYLADLEQIDDAAFLPLAAIVAAHNAKPFGVSGQDLADLFTLAKGAEADLERITAPKRTRRRLRLDSALRFRR